MTMSNDNGCLSFSMEREGKGKGRLKKKRTPHSTLTFAHIKHPPSTLIITFHINIQLSHKSRINTS